MSRIMREMLEDMWPMMSPDGQAQLPPQMAEQLRLKMTPGMQAGELPGSLHDALMKLVPNMKMNTASMKPGASDPAMIKMMLDGWRRRTANLADVPPLAMTSDPVLQPKVCSQTAALSAATHSGSEVAP